MPETATKPLIDELVEQRKTLIDEAGGLIDKREEVRTAFLERDKSDEKPSDDERSAFAAEEESFNEDQLQRVQAIKQLDRRIDEQELIERRRAEAARASRGSVSITDEPLTYRKDLEGSVSYFADLATVIVPGLAGKSKDPAGAAERLSRHSAEMNVELPKRAQGREQRAQRQIDEAERSFTGSLAGVERRGLDASPFERRVNPNRTDGQGGYFVPPLWLIDEYIPYLRAGRETANLCRQMDLPEGTDSINIPKLLTGTATGIQSADAVGVTSVDFTDTSVSAGVKTIAGQEDVSIQLLEQSPGQIVDRVIMEDLLADYNQKVDVQVLMGTGSAGQVTGLLPIGNWSANTVTWTSATPLGQSFYQALGAAVSKTAYSRFNLQNLAVVLHPRRWFWFATALDGASGTSGRPLVNSANTAFNTAALENDPAPFEGRVGHLPFGPDVHIDANVPVVATAAGAVSAGANDLALAAKFDDCWLFEGALRTRVLPEILSGTLQIRFQVYNYLAFLVRYGPSVTVGIGTGFAAPAGAIDSSITF